MKKMMQEASMMRKVMKQKQKELSKKLINVTGASGQIKVTMDGTFEVRNLTISPELLAKNPSVIENLLIKTFNEAIKKAQKEAAENMKDITGNMGGLGSLLGGGK